MTVRLSEYEAFLTIVEQNGFSAAARMLDCSPSSMSKMVKRIEDRLGTRLLNRNSRSLSLTPDGTAFYQELKRALYALRHAEASVFGGEGLSGVLRLSTSLQLAQYYLAPKIADFKRLHQDISLELFLRPHNVHLIEHQIDIAVFSGEQPDSTYIAKKIGKVRWALCASAKYVEKYGMPHSPTDLMQHRCLNFLPSDEVQWYFDIHGERLEVTPVPAIRANSGDLLRAFALLDMGIAQLPYEQIKPDLDSGRLCLVLEDYYTQKEDDIYAIYASSRNLTKRARAFLDHLSQPQYRSLKP